MPVSHRPHRTFLWNRLSMPFSERFRDLRRPSWGSSACLTAGEQGAEAESFRRRAAFRSLNKSCPWQVREEAVPDSLVDWLAFARIEGTGPVFQARLLERFGSPSRVFAASRSQLEDPSLGLRKAHADAILRGPDHTWALSQLAIAEHLGAAIVSFDDPGYPAYLRAIHAPPPVLYVLGCVPLDHPRAVGVVGTRNPTTLGGEACAMLSCAWVRDGVRIVSGLARGIDEIAHRAALETTGETLAVLGCGLDQMDSPSRRGLARDISCHGALVSEFPFGDPVGKGNFPRRNRIIAGLSRAVVVAEAGEKSGALITARFALEQGREVLACPGPAGWESFAGCHRLLRQGAALCARPEDLHEALGWEAPLRVQDEGTGDALLNLLTGHGATLEEIAIGTGRSIPEIQHRIVLLEMTGAVVRSVGGRWRRHG